MGWWSTIYNIEMGSKLTIMKNLLPFVVAPGTSYGKYTNMLAINSIYTHGNLEDANSERTGTLTVWQPKSSEPSSPSK